MTNAVLSCSQLPEENRQPILYKKVKIAVAALKKGDVYSAVDRIPAEFVQASGVTMIDVLTEICRRIWRTERGNC